MLILNLPSPTCDQMSKVRAVEIRCANHPLPIPRHAPNWGSEPLCQTWWTGNSQTIHSSWINHWWKAPSLPILHVCSVLARIPHKKSGVYTVYTPRMFQNGAFRPSLHCLLERLSQSWPRPIAWLKKIEFGTWFWHLLTEHSARPGFLKDSKQCSEPKNLVGPPIHSGCLIFTHEVQAIQSDSPAYQVCSADAVAKQDLSALPSWNFAVSCLIEPLEIRLGKRELLGKFALCELKSEW